jgi:hypothetical protein
MSPELPIEVVCEISSLEPISGRLSGDAGRSEEFRGWMDFATALLAVAGDPDHPIQAEPVAAPHVEKGTK